MLIFTSMGFLPRSVTDCSAECTGLAYALVRAAVFAPILKVENHGNAASCQDTCVVTASQTQHAPLCLHNVSTIVKCIGHASVRRHAPIKKGSTYPA